MPVTCCCSYWWCFLHGHCPLDPLCTYSPFLSWQNWKKTPLVLKHTVLSTACLRRNFTHGSKTNAGVAAVHVSTNHLWKLYTCCLHDDSSVYTREIEVILLALWRFYHSQVKPGPVDSHSSIQATSNMKYKIQDYFIISSQKLKHGWTLTTWF